MTIPVIAGYAPNGDILSANDSANGNWTYTYDDFNRLLTANATGQAYTYDYDRYGNRWHQNGPHSSQLAFDANNHISGVTGVGYDASGDTTGDATTTYTYDAEGRISSSSNSSNGLWCNTYNAEGQRVRKTNVTQGTCAAPTQSNSWDFLYDLSAHEIAMISGTGVWDRGEVYVGARRVATYNNGTTYFIHTDQLGTDRVRTTISGSVYQACNNLPFGDNFSCPGSDATPMHFTGKNHLYESGLDDFGARYLADTMGRFMTPDLMGGHQEDPQTLNKYSYVRNNPLNLTDPTGLDLYLQGCGNDTNTCKDNFVGTTNDKGKFTRTTIQSDENGDFDGHDVSFNSTGIHIDDKYQGVYAPGTDATRVNGDEDSGFSGTHFVVNSNCLGTCLAGGALYSDTKDTNVFKGVIAVLEGPNKRFDALGGHPGQQYRGGNHNGPDAHLSYVLDGQGNPTNGMPFHIDKRNPFHSVGGILVHGGDLTEYEFKAKILGQQPPPLPADIRPRDNQ